jgi:hypothetical protein
VKVYLDEDLSPAIAKILRRHGVDATSAHEVGNTQLNDRAQLAYATGEARAIVTANVADFIALAHEAVATNREHAGIVLVPSSFRKNEYPAISDAIIDAMQPYRSGVRGLVIYVRRGRKSPPPSPRRFKR